MNKLKERFIRYCKINTRSNPSSTTIPSTKSQKEFVEMLAIELKEIGLKDVKVYDKNGFVIAKLPSNVNYEVPAIGFIAHVDTADYEANNVNPQIIENYDGNDIILNSNKLLSPSQFPNLKDYIGKTLITTDGNTLLGADDKAGVSEIIEAIKFLYENPQIEHGDIYIGFGPDEEIGTGADHFDPSLFPVAFAYTVDGSRLGEIEYENFNAAVASISFTGTSVHPGSAKDKMINPNDLFYEFNHYLPSLDIPSKTDYKEGFYMLCDAQLDLDKGSVTYIIRDHSKDVFEYRKDYLNRIVNEMNKHYQKEVVSINIKDQYYNMKEIIEKDMRCIELANKAMRNLNIKPISNPIRGGTDGSKISFMGIPTPNLFTGGENFHGPYEFACLEVMEQAKQVIIEIIKLNAKEFINENI